MPRIPDYTSQVNENQPLVTQQAPMESPINQGLEKFGAGLESAGSVVEKAAIRSEVSDVHAKLAQAHADMFQAAQETLRTADPNDKDTTQNFLSNTFDDYMDQVADNIHTGPGRNYFNKASAALRTQLADHMIVGQADLAKTKALSDYNSALDNYSTSVLKDPSTFDDVIKMHTAGIDALVEAGGLSTKDAITLKEKSNTELAKSAMRGWINLDPAYAKTQIEAGRWDEYINGDIEHQMLGEVKQAERANDADEERQKKKQAEILGQQQMQTQNDFLDKMQKGELTAKDILNSNLDAFGSGSKEAFIQLLKAQNRESIEKTDPQTFKNLLDRIHLPDGDPNKIVDENTLIKDVVDGKLGFNDMQKLRGEIQGKRTEQGAIEADMKKKLFDVAESQLVKKNQFGIMDPGGAEQLSKFTSFYYQQYQAQRQQGKSVMDLLDPNSKDYLGKYIPNFKPTQQQLMQEFAPKPPSPAPLSILQQFHGESVPTGPSAAAPPQQPPPQHPAPTASKGEPLRMYSPSQKRYFLKYPDGRVVPE